MPQTVFLLRLMAQISGLKVGKVFHKLVNCHIYEDQIELMRNQLLRTPYEEPTFHISNKIKCLKDLEEWADPQNKEHFWVEDYKYHEHIKYPFSA